jgi:hypothetical protein
MDNFRREILVVRQKILGELRSLNVTLLGVQKQVETVAKEQQAKNEREQSQPVVRAELQVPPAIHTQNVASDAPNERRDKIKTWIEVATLFAVVAYAIINYHMLCQMRKANKTASDSFDEILSQMKAQTAAQQTAADASKIAAKAALTQASYIGAQLQEMRKASAATEMALEIT